MKNFNFTFKNLKEEYKKILKLNYQVMTCNDYVNKKPKKKTLVNRIDVDILEIFRSIKIKGTFFFRMHASEYNLFSFESYRIIKKILKEGHEIGYHSEVMEQSIIWGEDPVKCLKRDIEILEKIIGVKINGIASHGSLSGINNLDFWNKRLPSDFDISYEAYDKSKNFGLFWKSIYVSDSNWNHWKSYKNGKIMKNCQKSPSELCKENHNLIYLTIHPETYYNQHFHEEQ